ncbi:MAG: hypothetical protein HY259_12360 [Chloroflexi bacterium]|nr:hypothetical protein [Chloroflexota bacterium]
MSERVELELALPKNTYDALKQAAERKQKSEAELAIEAIEAYVKPPAAADPLVGLFADEPELIDQIMRDIMEARETTPLRAKD